MKKLWENRFIKLPCFLGVICLVFSALLAITVHFTQPIIDERVRKQEAEAYQKMYSDFADFGETTEINSGTLIFARQVKRSNNGLSYVYKVTTKKGYSGTITFLVGIDSVSSSVDAYQYIEGDEDVKGVNAFKNNDAILNSLKGYSGKNGSLTTSPTTPATSKVVLAGVDEAFTHYYENFGEELPQELTEAEREGITAMYGTTAVADEELLECDNALLNFAVKVTVGDEIHYVYRITTAKGYSGNIQALIGLDATGTVDGYYYLTATEDALGITYFSNNEKISNQIVGYPDEKPDFITDTTDGSQMNDYEDNNRAPVMTIAKFKVAVDAAISHFEANLKEVA